MAAAAEAPIQQQIENPLAQRILAAVSCRDRIRVGVTKGEMSFAKSGALGRRPAALYNRGRGSHAVLRIRVPACKYYAEVLQKISDKPL